MSNTESPLQALIADRRTVHEYEARPLPQGALARALAAASCAPNHRLTEPWRFTRVGPETRKALLDLGLERYTRGGRDTLPESVHKYVQATVINPAELLIASQQLDPRPEVRGEDYAAVACAIQNLMLALWSEGIGSKWDTMELSQDPRTYQLAGIDPERERIVGFVWLGYAARGDVPKARRKLSSDEILRRVP